MAEACPVTVRMLSASAKRAGTVPAWERVVMTTDRATMPTHAAMRPKSSARLKSRAERPYEYVATYPNVSAYLRGQFPDAPDSAIEAMAERDTRFIRGCGCGHGLRPCPHVSNPIDDSPAAKRHAARLRKQRETK
jgi:hypothetical protein